MVPSKGLVESALARSLFGQLGLGFLRFATPSRSQEADTRGRQIIPQNRIFAYNNFV